MGQLEDDIVHALHTEHSRLPLKFKPRRLTEGIAEWVPLGGIAIVGEDASINPVAIGTGMKCLPLSRIPLASGTILHDWHAETLTIRAFNHFLVRECRHLAASPARTSAVLRWRREDERSAVQGLQPFTVHEGIRIFMYCSEAPCGDASMELVMEAQEDASPWPVASARDDGSAVQAMLGRGSFSKLGVVRRKPARADSPYTLSKSCSDKLALKQCTSLLSGLTCLLISPENAYLDTLILPGDQYRRESCDRAFRPSGRMHSLHGNSWDDAFAFHPFIVIATAVEFEFSRQAAHGRSATIKGSNISAVHTSHNQEILINGVLQGRRQGDPRGASMLSRKCMADAVFQASSLLPSPLEGLQCSSYKQLKESRRLDGRRLVKTEATTEALKGWVRNDMDDFSLDAG